MMTTIAMSYFILFYFFWFFFVGGGGWQDEKVHHWLSLIPFSAWEKKTLRNNGVMA